VHPTCRVCEVAPNLETLLINTCPMHWKASAAVVSRAPFDDRTWSPIRLLKPSELRQPHWDLQPPVEGGLRYDKAAAKGSVLSAASARSLPIPGQRDFVG
jgi:hypothetical protein